MTAAALTKKNNSTLSEYECKLYDDDSFDMNDTSLSSVLSSSLAINHEDLISKSEKLVICSVLLFVLLLTLYN